MQSCLPSSVDLVKNVINKISRSRAQYRSLPVLTLSVQEHITSLCQKQVPICLDVFVTCGCYASNGEAISISTNKDIETGRNSGGHIHVERWTCTFLCRRSSEDSVSDYTLLSTVEHCLRSSDFSFWFRSQNKKRPYVIHYRLGAPDEVLDMSATAVSFAQVFPVVHIERNTCLHTAMASFFNSDMPFHPGCEFCLTGLSNVFAVIEELDSEHEKSALRSKSEEPPSQKQRKNSTTGCSSNSNHSSRSSSPTTCALPFSTLPLPLISTTRCKNLTKEATASRQDELPYNLRPLNNEDIETYIAQVKEQSLTESSCASFNEDISQQNSERPKPKHNAKPGSSSDMSSSLQQSPLTTSRRNPIARNTGHSPVSSLSSARCFNPSTGLPLLSSPAPLKRGGAKNFSFDPQLTTPRHIRSSFSGSDDRNNGKTGCTPLLESSSPLLGTFEESLLNGRIMPVGVVDGFRAQLTATGAFCSPHTKLPLAAYFFQLDEAVHPWASPYLGVINLRQLESSAKQTLLKTRTRYYIPPKGTVQVTLFNPNQIVLKMFVVLYDLSDMPPSSTTFIRQRTMYMPVECHSDKPDTKNRSLNSNASFNTRSNNVGLDKGGNPSFLRYLIHLRVATSRRGRLYLHSDVRLIFASDKFEFDSRLATYEMRSFTEMPCNPKFSPKK